MTGSASATSSKICRDRRIGKIRTPDDDLRDSLTGGARPNSIADSQWPNAPAGRHLVARRRRSIPSQIQKPAEGPSLRPSLALNIDPAPVHPPPAPLRRQLPAGHQSNPVPATAPSNSPASPHPHLLTHTTHPSHLHLIQSIPLPAPHPVKPTLCTSSSQGLLSLYLFQSSQPLACIIHRPWDELCSSSRPSSAAPQASEPPPVTRPVQDLVCSSSRQRPRVCI